MTVPGRSSEKIILVAHYDTWAGFSRCAPGADDNTS
ncbi:MAG: M28 family peptidase [Thermodesulfobacteriota bacterium]